MLYNKKRQPYDIVNRFLVTEDGEQVEYVRVKFLYTGNEQIIKLDNEKSGDFEDARPFFEEINPWTLKNVDVATEVEVTSDKEEEEEKVTYIATNTHGKEIEITDLEKFVKDNNLDMEAINAILEGKQKTHKGWVIERV